MTSRKLFFKKLFLFGFFWPHILAFCFSKNRKLIIADLKRRRIYRPYNYKDNIYAFLAEVLWRDRKFRNQFYLRIGGLEAFVLNMFLPCLKDMDLENCQNIGEGFCLIHGHGTIINRFSIIGKKTVLYIIV